MLLSVNCMEISAVLRNFPVPAGNHIKQRLLLLSSVFHCNFTMLVKRHLPVAVIAASRCSQHRRSVQYNILSIPVLEILIISTSEKCGNRCFYRRELLIIPIDSHHKGMSHIAGKPDMRNHTRSVGIA